MLAGSEYHSEFPHIGAFAYNRSARDDWRKPVVRPHLRLAGRWWVSSLPVLYIRNYRLARGCAKEFRIYNSGMTAGRPPRDPKAGAAKIVPIRLTDAEKTEYQRAANKAKLSLSEWVRDRLGKAAKRECR